MIELKSVYKKYLLSGEVFTALHNINLEIKKGEFTAIIGPSGSGKSTLMHIIGLLDHPSEGQVLINNHDVSALSDNALSTLRNEFVGFVFQQFNLINKLTILENILLPSIYARKKTPYNPKDKALTLMKQFDILGKENSFPNKLSGGQQQRVAIARALIMNPELILADEPTGNLDSTNGKAILELLHTLNEKSGVTVLLITHDKNVANKAHKKIKIIDGKIIH